MAKKILYESAVHHLVTAMKLVAEGSKIVGVKNADLFAFLSSLKFDDLGSRVLQVGWSHPKLGTLKVSYEAAAFYTRGDTEFFVKKQKEANMICLSDDLVEQGNAQWFQMTAIRIIDVAFDLQKDTTNARAR